MMPIDRYVQNELLRTNEEDFSAILKRLNVSETYLNDSVEILKKWFHEQPHFPALTITDNHFRRWICANKFSLEKTKCQIDGILTARGQIPEIFGDRDPLGATIQDAMRMTQAIVHPSLTFKNYRIVQTKLLEQNPDKYDLLKSYAFSLLFIDMRCSIDSNEGDILVIDYSNVTLQHFLKLTPGFWKKMVFLSENGYVARVKGIHLINCPSFGQMTINFVKSMLKKKISDRFHMHQSYEDLYKHLPRTTFPKDLGGDDPLTSDEMADRWKNHMMTSPEWRKWFIESSKVITDESKRPNAAKKPSMSDDVGANGTFRRLEID